MQKPTTYTHLSEQERIDNAILLAKEILARGQDEMLPKEKRREKMLFGLMQAPKSKAFCSQVADSCFRTRSPKRLIEHFVQLVCKYGIPQFFSPLQKACLLFVQYIGPYMPRLASKALTFVVQREMNEVLISGEEKPLKRELQKLKKAGIKVNLNRLGEAILGEREAESRIQHVLLDLENPFVDTVSIKISSIYSHINLIAVEETLEELKTRLRTILRKAVRFQKSVTLDMEEHKDLEITVRLFQEVLDEPEFHSAQAGIALQSYIPESYLIQEALTTWAIKRRGKAIKIRIVKGANLGMERVEASIKGWPQGPYKNKADVDANFKKMVRFGLKKEHAHYVHIGIGSHNIFDIAYAMILANEEGVQSFVEYEMLRGMAPNFARAVHSLTQNLLLYCPVAQKEEFHTAIAYLMRRLDENTAPDNFLTQLFNLSPQTAAWKYQEENFARSCLEYHEVSNSPRRCQNRNSDLYTPHINEPPTDFSIPHNSLWAKKILADWKEKFHEIPLVVHGKELYTKAKASGSDPSIPNRVIHTYSLAGNQEIMRAIDCAKSQKKPSKEERVSLLRSIAKILADDRASLIGAMVQEAGKIIPEADAEVCEAIDFATYYARQLEESPYDTFADTISLVITPWNFPCSIPASALLASLVTGHSILFKPAPEAVVSGWLLANAFWKAGVSKELLQFIPCREDPTGSLLVQDPRIDKVIFTGSTETARHFLRLRPTLKLYGETGGKNSIIVTSMSDRDLAVKDIVYSSFGYAGQKCSACSQLILEKEVYYDSKFRAQLFDATSSLIRGSAWNPKTELTPLIRPATSMLYRALTSLEPGQFWLVEPTQDKDNPNLWSPGIKFGVQKNSFTHQTELFGPHLSVLMAENLDEACDIANSTPYGLTAGLHSLDESEQELWLGKIKAGNCYILRQITGAIVGRQPFGGTKASSFGVGMKVGGPNYLAQLVDGSKIEYQEPCPSFCPSFYTDLARLVGQDNLLRYEPRSPLYLLFHDHDDVAMCKKILTTAKAYGCQIICGAESTIKEKLAEIVRDYRLVIEESAKCSHAHIRAISCPPQWALEKLAPTMACLDIQKPSPTERLEFIHYMREISISKDYHRYGNLMERIEQFRDPVL